MDNGGYQVTKVTGKEKGTSEKHCSNLETDFGSNATEGSKLGCITRFTRIVAVDILAS
jgi:hypothetical protein